TPAAVEAENETALMTRAKAAAKQFTEEEPFYYKCQENFQIMAGYMIGHNLPADSVDSFREAFSKTRAQLKQRPQPTPEDKARDYFEKVVHHAEGKDFTAHDLDRLSADEYARVMRIPKRAPLGSIMNQ